MPLTNYRDLCVNSNDLSAGFQFEFYCNNCSRTWKSPFQPYRYGQITSVFARMISMFNRSEMVSRAVNTVSDANPRGARAKALASAIKQAEVLYSECSSCHKEVCADCYDPQRGLCLPCTDRAQQPARRDEALAEASTTAATACPNCQTPSSGGRFCAECGFDMSSTHKSCPSCSAMMPRQARFCTDCGHSF